MLKDWKLLRNVAIFKINQFLKTKFYFNHYISEE